MTADDLYAHDAELRERAQKAEERAEERERSMMRFVAAGHEANLWRKRWRSLAAKLLRERNGLREIVWFRGEKIEALRRELAEVQEPLRDCLAFLDDDATRRHEALAAAFYRATGIMAPGCSVPLEMAMSQPPDDARAAAYKEWLRAYLVDLYKRAMRALAEVA